MAESKTDPMKLLEQLDREARSEPRVSTVLARGRTCQRGTKGCVVWHDHKKCVVPR